MVCGGTGSVRSFKEVNFLVNFQEFKPDTFKLEFHDFQQRPRQLDCARKIALFKVTRVL